MYVLDEDAGFDHGEQEGGYPGAEGMLSSAFPVCITAKRRPDGIDDAVDLNTCPSVDDNDTTEEAAYDQLKDIPPAADPADEDHDLAAHIAQEPMEQLPEPAGQADDPSLSAAPDLPDDLIPQPAEPPSHHDSPPVSNRNSPKKKIVEHVSFAKEEKTKKSKKPPPPKKKAKGKKGKKVSALAATFEETKSSGLGEDVQTQDFAGEVLEVVDEPGVVEPEVVEPEVVEPEVIEPEVIEPEVLEPEVVESELVEPEVVEPEVVELDPGVVEPEIIELESELVEPEVDVVRSEVVELEPEIVEPEVLELEMVEPEIEVIEPEIEAVEPEADLVELEMVDAGADELNVTEAEPTVPADDVPTEIEHKDIADVELDTVQVPDVAQERVEEAAKIVGVEEVVRKEIELEAEIAEDGDMHDLPESRSQEIESAEALTEDGLALEANDLAETVEDVVSVTEASSADGHVVHIDEADADGPEIEVLGEAGDPGNFENTVDHELQTASPEELEDTAIVEALESEMVEDETTTSESKQQGANKAEEAPMDALPDAFDEVVDEDGGQGLVEESGLDNAPDQVPIQQEAKATEQSQDVETLVEMKASSQPAANEMKDEGEGHAKEQQRSAAAVVEDVHAATEEAVLVATAVAGASTAAAVVGSRNPPSPPKSHHHHHHQKRSSHRTPSDELNGHRTRLSRHKEEKAPFANAYSRAIDKAKLEAEHKQEQEEKHERRREKHYGRDSNEHHHHTKEKDGEKHRSRDKSKAARNEQDHKPEKLSRESEEKAKNGHEASSPQRIETSQSVRPSPERHRHHRRPSLTHSSGGSWKEESTARPGFLKRILTGASSTSVGSQSGRLLLVKTNDDTAAGERRERKHHTNGHASSSSKRKTHHRKERSVHNEDHGQAQHPGEEQMQTSEFVDTGEATNASIERDGVEAEVDASVSKEKLANNSAVQREVEAASHVQEQEVDTLVEDANAADTDPGLAEPGAAFEVTLEEPQDPLETEDASERTAKKHSSRDTTKKSGGKGHRTGKKDAPKERSSRKQVPRSDRTDHDHDQNKEGGHKSQTRKRSGDAPLSRLGKVLRNALVR